MGAGKHVGAVAIGVKERGGGFCLCQERSVLVGRQGVSENVGRR